MLAGTEVNIGSGNGLFPYGTKPLPELMQGSKFHSSDRLTLVKMTVWQVEYLQDLSDGRLHISDFDISCIGFIYLRQ